jgi:hypothetical protein
MIIASVFNESTEYSDETNGVRVGVGTDPKTFDIYFGDSTPPPKVMSNHTLLYFVPEEGMEFNTTYYWKIDVWDALGYVLEGEIWNFTTRENDPPYTPNNPHPINGAINVPIGTNLSWSGGDPNGDDVTYDVYFGSVNPPPLVQTNHDNTTYDPVGILDFDTKYYWKIVALEEFGLNASGPIWSFTTESNIPPNVPSNPFPIDGAENVPVEATLNWTGGDPNQGDIVTYDVYFGVTNPPGKKSSNQSKTSFIPYPAMELFKTYYWRIVSWDSQEMKTIGPIWSFRTGINNKPEDPQIEGEINGRVLEDYEYIFTSTDVDGDNVSYYVDWDDGFITDWTVFQDEGSPGYSECHNWSEKGTYFLKAKAKDIWGYESGWTTLELIMPKSKWFIFNFSLFRWFFELFPNFFPIFRQMLGL